MLAEIAHDPILAANFLSVKANSRGGHVVAQFIADVEYLLESQVRWYEHLWPGATNEQSTDAGLALMKKFRLAAFYKSTVAVSDPEFSLLNMDELGEKQFKTRKRID